LYGGQEWSQGLMGGAVWGVQPLRLQGHRVDPRGVDGGWGRVVATDYAAPENIFAHFWRGVPQKNFFVGFPNISWPGQLSTG